MLAFRPFCDQNNSKEFSKMKAFRLERLDALGCFSIIALMALSSYLFSIEGFTALDGIVAAILLFGVFTSVRMSR
jgi:hypothetical protein